MKAGYPTLFAQAKTNPRRISTAGKAVTNGWAKPVSGLIATQVLGA
ncbi:MAG TPA: hypothetical protein VGL46_00915 [Pseudonocardiaceae bacterium]|jgi:hypothetical protein